MDRALDLKSFYDGGSTSLFFTARSADDRIVAGMRVHGPLRDSADAHAVEEFASAPESAAMVRKAIEDRLVFGAIEIKGCWVAQDCERRGAVADALARSFLHAMTALDVQFAFCTAATHAMGRWLTTGGQLQPGLEPVAYPDERYRTLLMWWNRSTLQRFAEPEQLRRFRAESAAGVHRALTPAELSTGIA